jgi:hemolysin activation/secretion protein
MVGEKTLSCARAVGFALVLLIACSGCGDAVSLKQRLIDHEPSKAVSINAGQSQPGREGTRWLSLEEVLEKWSETSPSSQAGIRESVVSAPATSPASSAWGRLAPRVAYRQALDQAEKRYEGERKELRTKAVPHTPGAAAQAKLRFTRAVEAARSTYRNAHLFQALPEDQTDRFSVSEIRISGNTQIASEDLLFGLPALYVDAPPSRVRQVDAHLVYDFRPLCELIAFPGSARDVSQRTILGLTKYILARYRKAGFVGVYVYVPARAVDDKSFLEAGILPVHILEGRVARVAAQYRDFDGQDKAKPSLQEGYIGRHSPVQPGQVIRKDDLDGYVRLLNANPDRQVRAVVSPGAEPNLIDLVYDVYERDPWHFYAQIDNSGTDRRQWNPRVGVLNTNFTGRDDRLSAMVQGDVESLRDNYAAFGLYEFPVEPRLRLGVYAGVSKFDITREVTAGLVSFLGAGWFTGLTWRYNVTQVQDWMLDFTGSVSRETSEVERSLGTHSDVDMLLAGLGLEIHRTRETSGTSAFFERTQNFLGQREDFESARLGADPDFARWTLGAAHWQFVDPNRRIHRLSARVRGILPTERLVPAKMTTFGGLYTVRGYPEDQIVADGGLLASAEYRFYLSRFLGIDVQKGRKTDVSLVAFSDYGRPTIKDPMAGELDAQDMWGMGVGTIIEITNPADWHRNHHFLAALYYSWALQEVRSPSGDRVLTDEGDGQWNFNFLIRF